MGQYEREQENRRDARLKRKAVTNTYSHDSEFVNLTLSEEQREQLRVWRASDGAADNAWQEAVENGYKFTIRYDSYDSCCVAFMFPEPDGDNKGFILTGRASSPYGALASCLFKHAVVLRGLWSRSGDPAGRRYGLEE
jgi:hypothetical protein